MLVLTQLDTTVFKRLVVLIALSYYWRRMKIWQTTRSAPGRNSMNARLVKLWCFVSTILPQKSLASSSIWSVLSRPPYVFCVPKCRHKRLKSSTTKKEFCFFFSFLLRHRRESKQTEARGLRSPNKLFRLEDLRNVQGLTILSSKS